LNVKFWIDENDNKDENLNFEIFIGFLETPDYHFLR